MDSKLIKSLKNKINEKHNVLIYGLKKSIQIAAEIGGYLKEVKSNLNHGEFGDWIENNCIFNWKTANNYINCFKYKNKFVNVTNLQEAYKQIEHIERKEKEKKEAEQLKKVIQYKNTGNEDASNVTITDNIPTGTTFQEILPNSLNQCSYSSSNNQVSCNIGIVSEGESGSVGFGVIVD